VSDCYWVDYPISTNGTSARSNSGLGRRKDPQRTLAWLAEYGRIDWPVLAPIARTHMNYAIIEAICLALVNTGRSDLLMELDVPTYFAQAMFHDGPSRMSHIRRYFRASSAQKRGPVRSVAALAKAFVQRATIHYLGASPVRDIEIYETPFVTQCHGIRDTAELVRVQERVFGELGIHLPWEACSDVCTEHSTPGSATEHVMLGRPADGPRVPVKM
jgi:hypothetical protein